MFHGTVPSLSLISQWQVPAWSGVLSMLAKFWVKIGQCKYHLTLKLWFLGAAASGAPKPSLSKSKVSWTLNRAIAMAKAATQLMSKSARA
jgi:hypothetical protein